MEHRYQDQISADEALERLVAGNARFCTGDNRFPKLAFADPPILVDHQSPFAAILGCSDSRVPPEFVFDADLGELFVIRVAGNTFGVNVGGSLQYAASHLNTPLFVVLGHEGCGAVTAALQTRDQGAEHHSRIQFLVNHILPGLPLPNGLATPLAAAVESNVRWTVRQICNTPDGQEHLLDGQKKIIGAIYDIATGRVRFLD